MVTTSRGTELDYRDRIQQAVTPAEELKIIKDCIKDVGHKLAGQWVNPWSLWYEIDRASGNVVDLE